MNVVTIAMSEIEAIGFSAEQKEYVDSCAVARTNDQMTFDADAQCYLVLAGWFKSAKVSNATHLTAVKSEAAAAVETKQRRPCGCGGRSIAN